MNEFKRFDVVSDDSDHHYLESSRPQKGSADCFCNAGSAVYKKIMKEWRILEQNLPEAIYVRVFEKRIDLMRAVIVGAAGTPYHDGLFFFDVAFPPDYPTHPPKVHYRSFGLRINPNLYANGKVCLSLLNTWNGKKREKWDPSTSTLLQVLLSIQALVLNEKPFFNEPGYEFGRAIFEKKSRAYNEDAFILTCRTTIYLIRKPPKTFEAFVNDHFRERGHAILNACNEYANGRVGIGYYSNDGSCSSSSTVKVSARFKTTMQGLYPLLVAEFQKVGASVGASVEQLKLDMKSSKKTQVIKQKSNRILKNLIAKIKKLSGLKKGGKNELGDQESA